MDEYLIPEKFFFFSLHFEEFVPGISFTMQFIRNIGENRGSHLFKSTVCVFNNVKNEKRKQNTFRPDYLQFVAYL